MTNSRHRVLPQSVGSPIEDPLRDNPRSSGALLDTLEVVPVAVPLSVTHRHYPAERAEQ